MKQEIICRNCWKKFNSNQTIIRKQEQLEEVQLLDTIRCSVIPQEIYIAECPYCRAAWANAPIYTQEI